jgi:hypothetical protein
MTLPPIHELRSLFHYNPLTGAITYLQQRGPRKPGDPAAQAVLNAWLSSEKGARMLGDPSCLAAALRAVVNFSEYLYDSQDGKIAVVRVADLEDWAAELEGHHA